MYSCSLQFQLGGLPSDMKLYVPHKKCKNWVEIKHQQSKFYRGIRFLPIKFLLFKFVERILTFYYLNKWA